VTGLDGGLGCRLAFVLCLSREFYDQDGVLGRQPDQNDQADLRQDVVVHSAQMDPKQGSQDRKGDDEDDG